jgi:hypothetical protein
MTGPDDSPALAMVVVVLNRDPLLGRDFSIADTEHAGLFINALIQPSAIQTYVYA